MNTSELNKYIMDNHINEDGRFSFVIPRIELNDGESLSVQATENHYCKPRENEGPWHLVEVGYPSVDPGEVWREYFDGDWENESHTDSVYGYVPIDLVIDFINAHGGMKQP